MITKDKIITIQNKIKAAISKIEADENVTIEFGNIRFNTASYTSNMTIKTNEKSEAVSNSLLLVCRKLGFTQNIIGMKFIGRNGEYEIIDIKPKNFKYPVIAKNSKGTYKFSVKYIKDLMGGDKIINRNANLDKLI